MTVGQSVHRLVDILPDDRMADVLDYLAELSEPDESISADTRSAIEEGRADIRDGRTVSLDEYRRTRGL